MVEKSGLFNYDFQIWALKLNKKIHEPISDYMTEIAHQKENLVLKKSIASYSNMQRETHPQRIPHVTMTNTFASPWLLYSKFGRLRKTPSKFNPCEQYLNTFTPNKP